jgi:flavin-dependent dehydrogenase
MADQTDVVVAGGGPAGLATAIAARLQGLDVVVLDRLRQPPIDKACGEGLMPDGASILESLGVDLRAVESRPFRGIRYLEEGLVAEGEFPARPGVGVRRTELHRALVQRAEDLDVDLRWGQKATGVARAGFETDDGLVRGRWLVGADGRSSRVRQWSGLAGRPARRRRFGVRRHFKVTAWTDRVEVHWADRREAYVTPVGDRLVGVALLWSGGAATFDDLIVGFPRLCSRLENAPVASKDRGAGPLEQRCRSVVHGNLALVGDASGYLDAITGEGVALSFQQAVALVDAMVAGDLGRYAAAHRRIGRYPNSITRLLLLVEAHPWLRRRVMRSLAADPSLMSRFLALKMRPEGPNLFGSGGLLPLAAAALRGGR